MITQMWLNAEVIKVKNSFWHKHNFILEEIVEEVKINNLQYPITQAL